MPFLDSWKGNFEGIGDDVIEERLAEHSSNTCGVFFAWDKNLVVKKCPFSSMLSIGSINRAT